MWFEASAPGSLMLMGEHAVLHGKTALVCAIDKRITVRIEPRDDKEIVILAEPYGEFKTALPRLAVSPPFHFVTASLRHYRDKIPSGCTLNIHSEFSDQLGLGSSAAVTVATVAALELWIFGEAGSGEHLIRQARGIIRKVQGLGSGGDVAASVMGGIVAYRARPFLVEKFSLAPPITVIYSGSKMPTTQVVNQVKERFAEAPYLLKALCNAIHQGSLEGVKALREQNWPYLGKLMHAQQGLMQALGVSTPLLDNLLMKLCSESAIIGAKISGSGLGDCILGLGDATFAPQDNGIHQVKVRITTQGVDTTHVKNRHR